jgi:hypothetical protein
LRGIVTAIEPAAEPTSTRPAGLDGSATAEHRFSVTSEGLTLHGRSSAPVAVGDAVVAYLRPEDLVVLEDDQAGDFRNVVDGQIERVIFEGPTAQLHVRVADRRMRVDVGGSQRLTLSEGRGRVRLGFNDLTVVPAEAAPAGAGLAGSTEEPV